MNCLLIYCSLWQLHMYTLEHWLLRAAIGDCNRQLNRATAVACVNNTIVSSKFILIFLNCYKLLLNFVNFSAVFLKIFGNNFQDFLQYFRKFSKKIFKLFKNFTQNFFRTYFLKFPKYFSKTSRQLTLMLHNISGCTSQLPM